MAQIFKSQQAELRARVAQIVEEHSDVESYPDSAQLLRDFIETIEDDGASAEELAVEGLQIVGIAASIRQDGDQQRIAIHGPQWSFLTPDGTSQSKSSGSDPTEKKTYKNTWPYLLAIMRTEKRDLLFVVLYSAIASLLGLVLPLTSQAIVNSVALGVYTGQLAVLCFVALIALLLMAALAVFERHIVDLIQRRLFVRTAFDIVYRLPLMDRSKLGKTYTPELVNRFFDVMTVQKSISKFLIDGINGALVLLTGLVLLAVYHPFFLVYDIGLLLFMPVLAFILGRGAINASIQVSKTKYSMASWLEDVARTQTALKVVGANDHVRKVADRLAMNYAVGKHKQYLIYARQIAGSFIFKAFATVGILALGGFLVIEQQISLGQLVAAEIVVILIIGALEKLINQFDAYYDLSAAVDKLGAITRQPLEDIGGQKLQVDGPLKIEISSPKSENNLTVLEPGTCVSLEDSLGEATTTLLNALAGISSMPSLDIKVNGQDLRLLERNSLRRAIGLILVEDHIIQGSIRDNILLGRVVPQEDMRWALELTGLDNELKSLDGGLDTILDSNGENLSKGLTQLIFISRMIIHKPQLLMIADGFSSLSDGVRSEIQERLLDYKGWTIINVSSERTLRNGSVSTINFDNVVGGVPQ